MFSLPSQIQNNTRRARYFLTARKRDLSVNDIWPRITHSQTQQSQQRLKNTLSHFSNAMTSIFLVVCLRQRSPNYGSRAVCDFLLGLSIWHLCA